MISIDEVRKIYGNSDGYVFCDNCPLYEGEECKLECACTGYGDAYEAIAKHLNSLDNVNDSVNHPSHYTRGKIEVIDFIADQKLNFNRGNAVKYICRAGFKANEIEDLEKAIVYLQHEIKVLKDNG